MNTELTLEPSTAIPPPIVAVPSAPSTSPIVSSLGPEPWKAPFWRVAEGDRATFIYLVVIHLLAAVGVAFFAVPGWKVALITFLFVWIGGLGVTICYHRALAHTALRLNPLVRHTLIFFAMFNGSGSPDTWTANHRQHHARVETPEDISSPSIGGFWWSHLRWLWQAGQVPLARWCPDLDKPQYRFWKRIQIPLLAVSLFMGAPFGWAAFFWLGPMRLVTSLHLQCFINSIAHMRPDRRDGEDSSQNIAWLSVLHMFQGENWHGNHHAKPSSARFGWTFWQIDTGWYFIVLLEKLGLATKVKRANFLKESVVAAHESEV